MEYSYPTECLKVPPLNSYPSENSLSVYRYTPLSFHHKSYTQSRGITENFPVSLLYLMKGNELRLLRNLSGDRLWQTPDGLSVSRGRGWYIIIISERRVSLRTKGHRVRRPYPVHYIETGYSPTDVPPSPKSLPRRKERIMFLFFFTTVSNRKGEDENLGYYISTLQTKTLSVEHSSSLC